MFSFTSPFAIPINKKFGTKWTLVLASLTYAFYIASFLPLVYKSQKVGGEKEGFLESDGFTKGFFLFGSVLTGMGAGPLWVS